MRDREQARREALAKRRADALRHRQLQGVDKGKPEGGWSMNLPIEEGKDIFGAPLADGEGGSASDVEPSGIGLRHPAPSASDSPAVTVLDIETTGRTPWLGRLLCIGIGDMALRPLEGVEVAREILASPETVVCHTSYDLRWLGLSGMEFHQDLKFHDTRVMGWLLGGTRSLALDDLCLHWLGRRPIKRITMSGGTLMFELLSSKKIPLDEAPWGELAAYNESDLQATNDLYWTLRAELQKRDMWDLFERDEVPLCRSLLNMEVAGLPFNLTESERLRLRVAAEAEERKAQLKFTGDLPASFNPGSHDQIAAYVFGHNRVLLKDRVPIGEVPENFEVEKNGRLWAHGHWVVKGRSGRRPKRKKTDGPRAKHAPTGSVPLVLANPEDEWIRDLALWREVNKLGTSFLGPFPEYEHNGRLFGTINRAGTETGRFSSSEPNLQQIPAHGNWGKQVRDLFVGDMVIGDYSQLEQRIAAHLSEDPVLLQAYNDGVDAYALAASLRYGGEPTSDHPQRGMLKTGVLALQYGSGAQNLATLLRVDGFIKGTSERASLREAEKLMDDVKKAFPRMFEWYAEAVRACERDGGVRTIGGRWRDFEFPHDWSKRKAEGTLKKEEMREGFKTERVVISTLCQGGAADVVAGALRALDREMAAQAFLILQVHDEILMEKLPGWTADSLAQFVKIAETGHGYDLRVPLGFEAKEVASWGEKSGGHGFSGFMAKVRESRS